MVRFSINEVTTYKWSFEQDVTAYAAAGVRGIGVWRPKLADCGEQRGAELLAAHGLTVSNLLWAGGFTGSDGRSLRESIDDGAEAIALAARLRAECLVVYSGGRGGHTHAHARRLVRTALEELAPLAAAKGVTLAIEPMHRDCAADCTFLTTLEDTLALIDAVVSGPLKLVCDTYHLGLPGGGWERLADCVERIAVVHLGDGLPPRDGEQCRTRLGCGQVPLREMVQLLLAAGYQGSFDVELIGEEIENANYAELIDHSQQAFSQLVVPTAVGS